MLRYHNSRDSPDYALCDMTVTVYRYDAANDIVTRSVIDGAYLDFRKNRNVDKTGSKDSNSFLLIVPADRIPAGGILLQDRVCSGAGPEILGRDAWSAFIPAKVPGLVVIRYLDSKYLHGALVHLEAGG